MPKQILAVRRPLPITNWKSWVLLTACGTLALATLAGGVLCLALHVRWSADERVLAPAGVVLLASFVAQVRLALAGWHNRRIDAPQNPLGRTDFWQGLIVGAFAAYLGLLFVGPLPYLGCAWLAAVSVWYAVLMLPLAASPVVLERWRKWVQARTPRRIVWVTAASVLVLVGCEAGLRARRHAREEGWFTRAAYAPAAETLQRAAAGVESPDELDFRFTGLSSGRFRVAILGDRTTLGGAQPDGYLARVQRIVPGLEIMPLEVSRPWSLRSADDLMERLTALEPDLALVVIPACENLAHEPAGGSWFAWRKLELVQCFAGESTAATRAPQRAAPVAEANFEEFLRALAPQLAACRTPIDPAMRARWQRTFLTLDDLTAGCRGQRIPLGLVIVPGQFQVNRTLCATLVRRAGYAPGQIDVDLPQRSLAGFAEHRELPVLDLLPHLRMDEHSLYAPSAMSWNQRGNDAAAAAIGGWLESCYGGQLALAAEGRSVP